MKSRNILLKILDYIQVSQIQILPQIKNSQMLQYYLTRKYSSEFSSRIAEKINFYQTILSDSSYAYTFYNQNKLAAFTTFQGRSYIAWCDDTFSLIIWNMKTFFIEYYLKQIHDDMILAVKHYFNPHSKVDFLITSSCDKTIKIFRIDLKISQITIISNPHSDKYCFVLSIFPFCYDRKNYIATISQFDNKLKIFDFQGNIITQKDSFKGEGFISGLFAHTIKTQFIFSCGNGYVKSYKFTMKLNDHKTFSSLPLSNHISAVVNQNLYLIEGDSLGILRIWDFLHCKIFKKIKIFIIEPISSLCLWNDEILFISSSAGSVVMYRISDSSQVKKFYLFPSKEFSTIEKCVLDNCPSLIIYESNGNINLFN